MPALSSTNVGGNGKVPVSIGGEVGAVVVNDLDVEILVAGTSSCIG